MPNAILRFHLRHLEQMNEYLEIMAPRQFDEIGDVLRDEGRSLVWPAVLRRTSGPRTLIQARRCGPPLTSCLGQ